MQPISLEKRLRMRPAELVSKKITGALMTAAVMLS